MGLNDILLRETVNPNLAAKGSELSFAEGDANLIELYNYLVSLNAGGTGIDVYNAGTTYTGTSFVSYDGNIYKHIAGSSTGVTPGTAPATWEITSIGELAHEKNKDQYLDYGGASQVDAASIYDIVANQSVGTTAAAFAALFVAGTNKKNRWYRIVDYSYFGVAHTLFVYSLDRSPQAALHPRGILYAKLPGVSHAFWVSAASYSVGARVKWSGKVWRNLTGTNTTTSPDDDGVRWAEESNVAYYRYAAMQANLDISSLGVISVLSIVDVNGNEFEASSYLDVCQDNITGLKACKNSTIGIPNVSGSVENVHAINSVITGGEKLSGVVADVKCEFSTFGLGANFAGNISDFNIRNSFFNFGDNFSDTITDVVIDGVNFSISPGELSSNVRITREGSNQEKTITSMALGGNCNHVGIFNVNTTATFTAMTGGHPTQFAFIIKPTAGNTVTLTLAPIAGATAGQFVGNGSSVVLEGNKGEYAKVQYRVINGVGVMHVLENNQIS